MKNFYRILPLNGLLFLMCLTGKSQLLSENFNSGLPATWTQSPTASWSSSSNLGTSGSGCAMAADTILTTPTLSLLTPIVNLTGVINLTVTFKMALVGNNFIVPNVSLYYNSGNGPQFLARWGSGYSPNTTYTIESADYSYDYSPPLDPQHVIFTTCTCTVPSIAGSIAGFIFDAELVNGGYVLIDDVVIAGKAAVTSGLSEQDFYSSLSVFPNPVSGKTVRIKGLHLKSIILSDDLGKVLQVQYAQKGEVIEIDLGQHAKGIYYITALLGDNTRVHKKIVLE